MPDALYYVPGKIQPPPPDWEPGASLYRCSVNDTLEFVWKPDGVFNWSEYGYSDVDDIDDEDISFLFWDRVRQELYIFASHLGWGITIYRYIPSTSGTITVTRLVRLDANGMGDPVSDCYRHTDGKLYIHIGGYSQFPALYRFDPETLTLEILYHYYNEWLLGGFDEDYASCGGITYLNDRFYWFTGIRIWTSTTGNPGTWSVISNLWTTYEVMSTNSPIPIASENKIYFICTQDALGGESWVEIDHQIYSILNPSNTIALEFTNEMVNWIVAGQMILHNGELFGASWGSTNYAEFPPTRGSLQHFYKRSGTTWSIERGPTTLPSTMYHNQMYVLPPQGLATFNGYIYEIMLYSEGPGWIANDTALVKRTGLDTWMVLDEYDDTQPLLSYDGNMAMVVAEAPLALARGQIQIYS